MQIVMVVQSVVGIYAVVHMQQFAVGMMHLAVDKESIHILFVFVYDIKVILVVFLKLPNKFSLFFLY